MPELSKGVLYVWAEVDGWDVYWRLKKDFWR